MLPFLCSLAVLFLFLFRNNNRLFPVLLSQLSAVSDKFLPVLRPLFSYEVTAFVIRVLEHIDHILRNLYPEACTAGCSQNRKRLSSGCRRNLFLLAFIDSSCLFIQKAQILHIVGCQRKDKAVLAGIDDCR